MFTRLFYEARLLFSVLSQNMGESATFVTLLKHSWYICFSTHSIRGNCLCYCYVSIIAKPHLYSSKIFCHNGLEAYISVHSSLSLSVEDLFIFVINSSTYCTIYCVLCLCHFTSFFELDINKYVFGISRNFEYNHSNSCYFLLSEVTFTAFLRH